MKKSKKDNKKKNNSNFGVSGKRLVTTAVCMIIIFVLLIIRIGWIQFVQGSELKEAASRQQTLSKIISPKRGTIYDTNGKAIAISAPVDTITINPNYIVAQDKDKEVEKQKTKELKEKVAKGLSDIFALDYGTVLAQVNSEKSIETIIKKVEYDKVEELKKWMEDNKITTGINIEEDSKRYYPYGNLASHLIGFTGTDSQGLYGLEYKWDSILKGTSGKIVTAADLYKSEISDNAEQYVEEQDGADLYLTIDVNLQSIVEKYLQEGVTANGADAGSVILMKPKTGDILAMATYPSYDLNAPFTINNDEDKEKWDTYSVEEKNAKLGTMWTDRNYNRTYEPGSTFKLIVSATALEENITGTDVAGDFHCEGVMKVADKDIKCAASEVHGKQSLRQALRNSCNGAFIQLGQRIGKETLYKYFDAFGLFEKTGAQIYGESSSNFHDIDEVGPVELATTSFGQRFDITPLQLITAVSAIVNDGKLMTPRIVKKISNTNTDTEIEVETNEVRKVISEETSKKMRDLMKSVAENRENLYGSVAGYTIGGKTGTSEPAQNRLEEGYVVSYIAIAPVEEPEVIGLVVVYNPASSNPYGSRIAAPIMSKILTECLPLIGIASENSDTKGASVTSSKITSLVDVTNKTLSEAKKKLENLGFKVIASDTQNSNSVLVTEQVPKAGTAIYEGGTVALYTEENSVRTSIEVPNLIRKNSSRGKSSTFFTGFEYFIHRKWKSCFSKYSEKDNL